MSFVVIFQSLVLSINLNFFEILIFLRKVVIFSLFFYPCDVNIKGYTGVAEVISLNMFYLVSEP